MKRFRVISTIIVFSLLLIAASPVSALTFTVDSTTDAQDANPGDGICETSTPGECTLRAAITEANASPGTDTISFNIPGSGPYTISPTSGFDFISDPVIIDGTTQPDFAGTPIIELDGSGAGAGIGGLTIIAGSTTVRGLVINRFDGYGIRIDHNGNNLVQGNFIGTDVSGTVALGNTGDGIVFGDGGNNSVIGGTTAIAQNVISGNGANGVSIYDGATGNVVQGNYIGTTLAGTGALGNTGNGVTIAGGSASNTIGGTNSGARNIISTNIGSGIVISDPGSTGNVVQGNYIGTDVSGSIALANQSNGVGIYNGATNNLIGGTTTSARNLISGNIGYGVTICCNGATANVVEGNYIGTDVTGASGLGNSVDGVNIDTSTNNMIGGTAAGAGNVISGNGEFGISIVNPGSTGNVIQGNFIGTNVTGSVALGNHVIGIVIGAGATDNVIGGTEAGSRNIISGNDSHGIQIDTITSTGNLVQGNYIGTDVTGTVSLGNADDGVLLLAPNNIIGGTTPAARNLISGNQEQGISIAGSEATGNTVQGNFIGTDVTGLVALGNGTDCCHSGIVISSGASHNTIGGNVPGAGNIISGNTADGVTIFDAGTSGNIVAGNFIGTDVTGTQLLGNSFSGVVIAGGASDNVVGLADGSRNIISGNSDSGITIIDDGTNGNVAQGNFIGTDVSGSIALANQSNGVSIYSGAAQNVIGGTTTSARNLISGNIGNGVTICCDGATANVVQGNFIGTDITGTHSLGNSGDGVTIFQAANNTIGGTSPGARNLISGNASNGVGAYDVGTTGNLVQGNYIGTDVTGMSAVGNSLDGVVICCGGASGNTVGGTALGAGNLISGNDGSGIGIYDDTTANVIQGNLIGTNATGTGSLGNGANGIGMAGGPTKNMIGGTTNGARNTIAFNGANGIDLTTDAGTGNVISSNSIYSNGSLGIDLGENGVTPNDLFDADSGPNNLQNFPLLNTVKSTSKGILIQGALLSTRNTTFRLEFFSNNVCDPSGYGEGQTYLGFITIKTNPLGLANFNITLLTVLPAGRYVTATATDPANNTSEFSQCVKITK